MNLRWNHILLACLLTVLEIYGTEATLLIPYDTIWHSYKAVEDVKQTKNAQLPIFDSPIFNLRVVFSTHNPEVYFEQTDKSQSNKLLFEVWRNGEQTGAVYYDPRDLVVTKDQPHGEIKVKSARPNSNENGYIEIILSMKGIREYLDSLNSYNDVSLSTNGDSWIVRLPHKATFTFDGRDLELTMQTTFTQTTYTFLLKYKVGNYPTKPGWWLNSMWRFTRQSGQQDLQFACNPSSPVVFHCRDQKCSQISFSQSHGESTIMGFVIKKNGSYRFVKGNAKAPKNLSCTLYVKNDYEVQFPLFGKRHVNVAQLTHESSSMRTGRGFRVFTNSLKFVGQLEV